MPPKKRTPDIIEEAEKRANAAAARRAEAEARRMQPDSSSSSSSSSDQDVSPIVISYSDGNIQINCGNNNPPTYSDITDVEPHKTKDVQGKLRYLDSKKDLLGSNNLDDVIKKAYGLSGTPPAYSMLSVIKKAYVNFAISNELIETKSWAKSKARASLEIKLGTDASQSFVFRESGMNLNEDIVNGCTDMACFSNTILDPFVRSFSKDAVHFPGINQPLQFDKSFLEGFLQFHGCDKVESKLLSTDIQKKGNDDLATYNYSYQIKYGSDHDNVNIQGYISYPGRGPPETNINKYVIGNENKNAFLQQVQKKSNEGPNKNIVIQVKEMGDVLQVFTMLAWYKCKNKVEDGKGNTSKKNFVMTTIDSIVFLLSIMIQMPCIVYEFKNEEMETDAPKSSAKQKAEKGRTRYLQRYLPQNFTDMEKINQTIDEIVKFNQKVINVITRIKQTDSNNRVVYISKTEIVNTTPDFVKFLKYLVSVIEFLTSFVKHLTDPTIVIKKDEMIESAKAAKVTLDDFDTKPKLLQTLKDQIDKFGVDTVRNPLLPEFLQFLKINFTVYEMFYEKQGKYYASTMITFLTQSRQQDPTHEENILFFPCNDQQRQQRGKMSFSIWCKRHEGQTQRQRGGMSTLNSGEIDVPIYERDIDDGPCVWTFQTVNMYRYLLEDIHTILQGKLQTPFLSDYILYDFYTLLAFHFNLCNEVYYPFSKRNDIVERIEMPTLSGYLKKGTTFNYLDEFIDYIIEEYNGYGNDPNENPTLIGPKSPTFEPGMSEGKCVEQVLRDLGASETTEGEAMDVEPTSEAVAAGVSDVPKNKGEQYESDDDTSVDTEKGEFIPQTPPPGQGMVRGDTEILYRRQDDSEQGATQTLQYSQSEESSHPVAYSPVTSLNLGGPGVLARSNSSPGVLGRTRSQTEALKRQQALRQNPSTPENQWISRSYADETMTAKKQESSESEISEDRRRRLSESGLPEQKRLRSEDDTTGGTRKKRRIRKNKRTRGNKKYGKKSRKRTRRVKNKKTRKH